jgi:hypothetical protein
MSKPMSREEREKVLAEWERRGAAGYVYHVETGGQPSVEWLEALTRIYDALASALAEVEALEKRLEEAAANMRQEAGECRYFARTPAPSHVRPEDRLMGLALRLEKAAVRAEEI